MRPLASAGMALTLMIVVGAGCAQEPPKTIGFYLQSKEALVPIHRAVLVDLTPGDGGERFAETMTLALQKALQGRMLFHIDVIPRTHPACRDLSLDKLDAYSLDELKHMRDELGCDVVLFGKVGNFKPYPRLQVALYLRMLDLWHGRLVWGVDHVWDTSEKNVESRIKTYFDEELSESFEPADWRLVTMSPAAFQKFIAYEVGRTLPTGEEMIGYQFPGRKPLAAAEKGPSQYPAKQ